MDLCVNIFRTAPGLQNGDNGRTMANQIYPNRLDEWMSKLGTNGAELGRKIDKTKQHISMLRKGEREMTVHWAAEIAPHLGLAWHDLLFLPSDPPLPPVDAGIAARLSAAVAALYGDDVQSAAEAMGIGLEAFLDIAAGRAPLPQSAMLKFCDTSKCPADWILRGQVTAAFPHWAMVRLLTAQPDLVADQAEKQPASP